jgi:acid phosphatase family membrane protein YuiD
MPVRRRRSDVGMLSTTGGMPSGTVGRISVVVAAAKSDTVMPVDGLLMGQFSMRVLLTITIAHGRMTESWFRFREKKQLDSWGVAGRYD